jgi:hypothetical protein
MIMRTRRIVFATLALICVQLQACKRSGAALTNADLPGLYVCNLPGSLQTVELRKDATFVQTIADGSEHTTYYGHWGLERSGFQVMLLPYHFEWPSYLGPPSVGAWVATAKYSGDGRMLLAVSEDDGLYCIRGNEGRG